MERNDIIKILNNTPFRELPAKVESLQMMGADLYITENGNYTTRIVVCGHAANYWYDGQRLDERSSPKDL